MNHYEITTCSGSVIGTVFASSEYAALKQAERLFYVHISTVLAKRI